MSVGLLEIDLSFIGIRSLKEKRSLIQPFIQRVRNNYNVSIAEIEGKNELGRSTLEIAHVGDGSGLNHRKLAQILDEAENTKNFYIERHSIEIL